jgi:hypothetical protein
MSIEWTNLQEDYLGQRHLLSKYKSGKLWITNIITALWSQFELVWQIRNEVIHGHDDHTRSQARRHKAELQIRTIYSKRAQLLPSDRIHLFDTVAEHLRLSTTNLINWTNTYQPLFSDSIKKARKNSTSGVRSITEYFSKPTDPPVAEENI